MSDLIKVGSSAIEKYNSALEFKQQQIQLINQTAYSNDIKKIMRLAVDVKFCTLSIEEKVLTVSNSIESAYIRTGSTKLNEDEKTFFINEVIDILAERKYATKDEVIDIFRKGSLGLLGDYFGVNVKSFLLWLDIFYKDVHRREIVKKLNDLQKANDKIEEMKPEDSQNLIRKTIVEVFNFRKENNQVGIEGLSYPMYDYLYRKGKINLSDQERKYLKEEAEAHIKITYSVGQKKFDDLLDKSMVDPIKLAKTFAVRDYFNGLRSKSIDLDI